MENIIFIKLFQIAGGYVDVYEQEGVVTISLDFQLVGKGRASASEHPDYSDDLEQPDDRPKGGDVHPRCVLSFLYNKSKKF